MLLEIILVIALLALFFITLFGSWGLFTARPRPGFLARVSGQTYWNLGIIALGVALVAMILILAFNYRDDQRQEERQVLQRIATAQEKILNQRGEFGLSADVIALDPGLYRYKFTIDNSENSRVSFITTSRCQIVLRGREQRGPSCGEPQR